MMTRLMIFEQALEAVRKLKIEYPWSRPLGSAIEQLEYLIAVESGRNGDRSKLAGINIGVIAAREVEDMEEDAANNLHAAAQQARDMRAA